MTTKKLFSTLLHYVSCGRYEAQRRADGIRFILLPGEPMAPPAAPMAALT